MILFCHFLLGAAIINKIKFLPLALPLAFLSHYLLDFIPHAEYSVKNINAKQWRKSFPDLLKIILDLGLGFLILLILPKNQPIIFIGGFLAILSDGLNFLNGVFPNKILKIHSKLHNKIHFKKDKKFSLFWKLFSEIIVVLISIFFLTQ